MLEGKTRLGRLYGVNEVVVPRPEIDDVPHIIIQYKKKRRGSTVQNRTVHESGIQY